MPGAASTYESSAASRNSASGGWITAIVDEGGPRDNVELYREEFRSMPSPADGAVPCTGTVGLLILLDPLTRGDQMDEALEANAGFQFRVREFNGLRGSRPRGSALRPLY
jgi:hypothetical protein